MSEQKKKRLRLVSRVIFFINSVFAALLLLSYVLPYAVPKSFPILSVLSLLVPVFIMINFIFMLFWILNVRKQFLLSFVVLILGYSHVTSMYKFSGTLTEPTENSLSLMSYNVRLFNIYDWIQEAQIDQKIVDLIKENSPDIIALQEFHPNQQEAFDFYPYQHVVLRGKKKKAGQAIFSKFPILHKGSIEFPNTSNNAIYIDIVRHTDTIRVYNLHLQSLHINPKKEEFSQKNSERLLKRMATAFKMQQTQAELFEMNRKNCPHKKIILGDFNNTQFSNVYKTIKGNMKDAFVEAGKGFGSTLDFPYFPMRIDFILTDASFSVNSFKTFSQHYSDHFAIKSIISLD
ncbi:endonuclease/exonuclease/phosphatase family metal-dependent hydrolase [Kordia periserrulae]|uniref:Endonuclease/exonuclease/phosphatase family metal-dependent hydrolase n=1 Tax=Kordia periserrulae TaxID=701523 RepID=A0A2T6C144_9FLAO|nr:endonuclease/exonuclease/phosphatase family protein [Kordia periserrulae]PTX61957.1 endonuclease/exonuclease/phosphatase family metal-dependent hydrolase [Kordia periserrulae]